MQPIWQSVIGVAALTAWMGLTVLAVLTAQHFTALAYIQAFPFRDQRAGSVE